jgi:hypothetical protein
VGANKRNMTADPKSSSAEGKRKGFMPKSASLRSIVANVSRRGSNGGCDESRQPGRRGSNRVFGDNESRQQGRRDSNGGEECKQQGRRGSNGAEECKQQGRRGSASYGGDESKQQGRRGSASNGGDEKQSRRGSGVEGRRPSLTLRGSSSARILSMPRRGSGSSGLSQSSSVRALMTGASRRGSESSSAAVNKDGGRRGSWSSKSLFKSTRRIFFLISNQKWDELRSFLHDDDGVFGVLQMEELFGGGQNAVHFLCRYQPPLDIVKTILQIYPEGVSELDSVGQTPLHVAVSWKASLGVVEELLTSHVEAATMQDSHGRTPLQLACNKICFDKCIMEKEDDKMGDLDNLHHIATMGMLKVLHSAAPGAIEMKDKSGRTVVDSAIRHGASDNVVKFLQSLQSGEEV